MLALKSIFTFLFICFVPMTKTDEDLSLFYVLSYYLFGGLKMNYFSAALGIYFFFGY